MKIYTKTGDAGTTGLLNGMRVSKASLRVEAYGTVDELNSIIGIVLANKPQAKLFGDLKKLSSMLFTLGSDLATPLDSPSKYKVERINEENIEWLEYMIDGYTAKLPVLKNFILPGGTVEAAFLHQARTVCRRAERLTVALSENEALGDYVVKFLNRLSDYLFTAARFANHSAGTEDNIWKKE